MTERLSHGQPQSSSGSVSKTASTLNVAAYTGGGGNALVGLNTAIDDYTRECAYATFDEKQKGVLAPGMLADVVVLATDVFAHNPTKASDIAVKFTIFDGKVVYRAAAPK